MQKKGFLLNVEEIRVGNSYGQDAEVKVRISHPLFKGHMERVVKRRDLPRLYELAKGQGRRRQRYGSSLNAGMIDIIASIQDGAHMDMGNQTKEVITNLGVTVPESKEELDKALGSTYSANRDKLIGMKGS